MRYFHIALTVYLIGRSIENQNRREMQTSSTMFAKIKIWSVTVPHLLASLDTAYLLVFSKFEV